MKNEFLNELPPLLLDNYISDKLAPLILSIKDEYTYLFFNFLIVGSCNSSANYLFDIFSFLIPLAEVFYQKI